MRNSGNHSDCSLENKLQGRKMHIIQVRDDRVFGWDGGREEEEQMDSKYTLNEESAGTPPLLQVCM